MEFVPHVVAEVRRETSDSVVIRFAEPMDFVAGQYVTVRRFVDGEEVRRCYSICASEGGPLQIGVKRVIDGCVSTWLTETVRVGDSVELAGPDGSFGAPTRRDRRIVAVAAGSGITPVISIAATVLERGGEVTLVYGNRRAATAMFLDALDDLKNRHVQRFRIWMAFSGELAEVEFLNGRIDAGALVRQGLVETDADGYYVCGPEAMPDAVTAALAGAGVALDRIHTERFAPGRPLRRHPQPRAEPSAAAKGAEVLIRFQGRSTRLSVAPGESILRAGLEARPDLPWSCEAGVCATCRARLVEGTVDMAVAYGLEDDERERGFVLTCQAVATSSKVFVDYDAT